MTVSVIVLPGPGDRGTSIDSATGLTDVEIVDGRDPSWPARMNGDLVAPLRAGDRLLPAKLSTQRAAVEASGAVLAVGAYRLLTSSGVLVDEVHPAGWGELDISVVYDLPEPASILVERRAMLSALDDPDPDALVPAALLAARDGATAVDDIVAEVALDLDPAAGADRRLRSWLPLVRDDELRRQPHASAVRRDLLARLYLDSSAGRWRALGGEPLWAVSSARHDQSTEAGPDMPKTSDTVIRDLQWALDRQAELIASMQVAWARELSDDDRVGRFADREIAERDDEIMVLHREVAKRDALVEELRRAVAERDVRLSALETAPSGAGRSSPARSVARRVVPEPIRRRLRR